MNQQGEDNTTQIRSCPRCSVVQPTQVRRTEYEAEQQDPRGGASTIAPDNVQARNPQVTVSANIFSHVLINKLLRPRTTLATHLSGREQTLQMWGPSTL